MRTSRPSPGVLVSTSLLSSALVLLLLTLAPFAAALEVHHTLAAADHDGHEHSDFDLCQWVQHHTGQSMLAVLPQVERQASMVETRIPPDRFFSTSVRVPAGSPRAPPVS